MLPIPNMAKALNIKDGSNRQIDRKVYQYLMSKSISSTLRYFQGLNFANISRILGKTTTSTMILTVPSHRLVH